MSFNRDFIKLRKDFYRRSHLLSRIRSFGWRKEINEKVLEQDLKELRGVQHQAPLQVYVIGSSKAGFEIFGNIYNKAKPRAGWSRPLLGEAPARQLQRLVQVSRYAAVN